MATHSNILAWQATVHGVTKSQTEQLHKYVQMLASSQT